MLQNVTPWVSIQGILQVLPAPSVDIPVLDVSLTYHTPAPCSLHIEQTLSLTIFFFLQLPFYSSWITQAAQSFLSHIVLLHGSWLLRVFLRVAPASSATVNLSPFLLLHACSVFLRASASAPF